MNVVPDEAYVTALTLTEMFRAAIAEAMMLGRKAGLDAKKIYEVVSVSAGNSVQFQNRGPCIIARNFTPCGTLDVAPRTASDALSRKSHPAPPRASAGAPASRDIRALPAAAIPAGACARPRRPGSG